MAIRLSEVAYSRQNHFNLIRILAALAVLFGHTEALLLKPEPSVLGLSLGSFAVDVFFVISGFLVGASLWRRQDLLDYAKARFFRIVPGLAVMLLLVVLVLAPSLTQFSLAQYFSDSQVLRYFVKCLTLLTGVEYHLPGVFLHNPYPAAVNGSLWTLPYEVKMYIVLAFLFFVVRKLRGIRVWQTKETTGLVVFIGLVWLGLELFLNLQRGHAAHLAWMFFSGVALFHLREVIVLKLHYAIAALALLVMASAWNSAYFMHVYPLVLPYLILYLAYLPSSYLANYNRLGDYSYGVYIYAFPIQQSLIALFPNSLSWQLNLAATVLTLSMAIFSWHRIEQPCLQWRSRK